MLENGRPPLARLHDGAGRTIQTIPDSFGMVMRKTLSIIKQGDRVKAKPRPFVVFGLPRSRTTWLSRFLTYADWVCGHDELRHMRSMDDISAWFSQPCTGTVETSGAASWRLLDTTAPGARVAIVRRPKTRDPTFLLWSSVEHYRRVVPDGR